MRIVDIVFFIDTLGLRHCSSTDVYLRRKLKEERDIPEKLAKYKTQKAY